MKDIVINSKYRVDRKIGQGGFGLVYAGTDLETQEEVAIKLSHIRESDAPLLYEAETYAKLSGGVGVPRILWVGHQDDYYVMVYEILGPSLEDLFNYCNRKFSLKTVLLIADQTIRRVKHIHDTGFLHCDLKPENFLLGLGQQGNVIYTIDFGMGADLDADEGYALRDDRPLGGTDWFGSLNYHNRQPKSRGDDLESLGYVFLYLALGSLPWEGQKASTHSKRREMIKGMKMDMTVEDMCKDLPEEFATYIKYARSVPPTQKPDYAHLLRLFENLFVAQGFEHDNVYDWTEKLFNELSASATGSTEDVDSQDSQLSEEVASAAVNSQDQPVVAMSLR